MLFQFKWGRNLTLAAISMAAILPSYASAEIVTSIRPLGFIAAAIADGVTETKVLLPDGASPHDYALRPSDAQKLRQAELVIWVGPEMEAFLNKPMQSQPAEKQLVLSQLPGVAPLLQRNTESEQDEEHEHDGEDDHHHGQYNMHIWLSPEMATESAKALHNWLLTRYPAKKQELDNNIAYFVEHLKETDENIRRKLEPVRGKRYFVFHDAYGYFERHYGLQQLGYFTINPEIQPGAQRLHKIRTELVEHKATCVLAEPQFRPASINAVIQGIDVHVGTLDPLGIGIKLDKESYMAYLSQVSTQFEGCLKGN